MSKYIDADKLISEIERRIESWTIRGKHSPVGQGRDTCESRVTELSDLLSFIASLQQEQPEVDLEDEMREELQLHYSDDQDVYWWNYLKNSFRHFYELGLKARKV